MSNITDEEKQISVEIARLLAGSITEIKSLLKLDSYDAVVIILKIASNSGPGSGTTEAELTKDLSISRSTVNRMLRRLVDTGHIVIIADSSPRRYRYSFEYLTRTHGEEAVRKRRIMQAKFVDGSIHTIASVFKLWPGSQFDQ